MNAIILGNGGFGRAIAAALVGRGEPEPRVLGRPASGRHDPADIAGDPTGPSIVFDASSGAAVDGNVEAALAAGARRFVIGTTAWEESRSAVERALRQHGAAAVAASNLSLGVALFGRLVDRAVELFGPVEAFDPYVVEWHRRTKADRPSGTAKELSRRILAAHPRKTRLADPRAEGSPAPDELDVAVVRAGGNPGSHLVGFDAAGESVELRIVARDRSAYALGALAAADWLLAAPRRSGLHSFDEVVDDVPRHVHPLPEPAGARGAARLTSTTHRPRETRRRIAMTRIDRSTSSTRPALRGVFTALVTPFADDGSLDEAALRQLVRWQVLTGIDGLVPVGTTGESPTLTPAERDRVIALTVETVAERPSRSRVTILAGTGTNDTAATVAATRRAAELGADAALVVAPYYNRPDQRMLEAHYRAVADDGGLPVVVYNVPSRTGTNVEAATLLRLAEHPRIVGVKEASGNLDQISWICRERPRDFACLAGDDAWTLAVMAMGGDGVVSVASNEIPGEMVALVSAARAGDLDGARRIHDRWLPLFRANFAGGPNPVPVKAALALMGLISDVVRQPLLSLDDGARDSLAAVLRQTGLLDPSGGRMTHRSEAATVGQEAVA